ncbi:MAG: Tfp pilus assembly protein FimT/FimU [Nitrospiria bacterium]
MQVSRRGFTLIEVVIVMLVMAILALVVVSPFNLSNARAGAAAKKLEADLRYAQQLANASRIRHGVEVTNGTSYRVFQDDGGGGTTVSNPMTGAPYIISMTGDFNGVSLTTSLGGAPPKAQFDSIGRPFDGSVVPIPVAAGANAINLLVSGSVVETVTVVPNTGVVLVN